MGGLYPTRQKTWWHYLPIVSIAALFWWITGLGVWVHFTQEAYNQSQNLINILQLTVASGPQSQVSRIYSSMVSTSVVYALFAVAMHALGLWRSMVEQRQDAEGEVDETANMYLLWANIAIQIAWWVIVIWLIVLGVGFGYFVGYVVVFRSAMTNTLLLQALAGRQPVATPGFCPVDCLSIASTGIFFYAQNAANSILFCICDQPTLLAANDAVQAAYSAVPGMLVGMLLMTVYGVVLLTYLVNMMVRLNMEANVSERLEEQGFAVGGTLAPPPKHQQAAPPTQTGRGASSGASQGSRPSTAVPQRPLLR